MGKLAKVMRWASIFADAGSSACTRESAAFTYRRVWNISTSQVKNRSISAEPRLVTEGTFCKPGTLFTASSSGRVMVTIIWSMGITPLSTPIRIRGKFVAGKTATGIVKAIKVPTSASVTIRKITDREWRANQYGDCLPLEATYCLSSLPKVLEAAASPAAGLSPSFSETFSFAVSIATLLLSGRP